MRLDSGFLPYHYLKNSTIGKCTTYLSVNLSLKFNQRFSCLQEIFPNLTKLKLCVSHVFPDLQLFYSLQHLDTIHLVIKKPFVFKTVTKTIVVASVKKLIITEEMSAPMLEYKEFIKRTPNLEELEFRSTKFGLEHFTSLLFCCWDNLKNIQTLTLHCGLSQEFEFEFGYLMCLCDVNCPLLQSIIIDTSASADHLHMEKLIVQLQSFSFKSLRNFTLITNGQRQMIQSLNGAIKMCVNDRLGCLCYVKFVFKNICKQFSQQLSRQLKSYHDQTVFIYSSSKYKFHLCRLDTFRRSMKWVSIHLVE